VDKPWATPFLQAHTDQKAAPATQKHRENTPEESVFSLQSTATFLNSLETGQKRSQQTSVADWDGGVHQPLQTTAHFRHPWIPSQS